MGEFRDYVIRTDGTVVPVAPEDGVRFSHREVREMIGPMYTSAGFLGTEKRIYFQPEGQAPINQKASILYQESVSADGEVIRGDALVVGDGS